MEARVELVRSGDRITTEDCGVKARGAAEVRWSRVEYTAGGFLAVSAGGLEIADRYSRRPNIVLALLIVFDLLMSLETLLF